MKRTTEYVALNVHQETTIASVREESGRELTPKYGPAIMRHRLWVLLPQFLIQTKR
jgi:hypothetical protein